MEIGKTGNEALLLVTADLRSSNWHCML